MTEGTTAVRLLLGSFAALGLGVVFVFQQLNWLSLINVSTDASTQFIVNRVVRFLLNDMLAIILIYALFYERKYVVFAVWVQVFGMMLFLVPYIFIKINYPTYNGPLINYIHRFIVNPVLLLLMIPAFYFQRFNSREQEKTDRTG